MILFVPTRVTIDRLPIPCNLKTSVDDLSMSATAMLQLKQQLSQISEKERQELAAYLHRLKQESPAYQKEMTRRMSEMDKGKKFGLLKA